MQIFQFQANRKNTQCDSSCFRVKARRIIEMNKPMAWPVDSRGIIVDLDLGRSPDVCLSLRGGTIWI